MTIQIGDTVKIISNGGTYTRWEDLSKEMGAINWKYKFFPDSESTGKVINIKKIGRYHTIALVRNSSLIEFLIEVEYIEIVKDTSFFKDEDFLL